MNSISASRAQTSHAVHQNKTPAQHQKPVSIADKAHKKDVFKLPDDIVTLSTSSRNTGVSSKKPSVPVSNAEKAALLQDPLIKSISIYV